MVDAETTELAIYLLLRSAEVDDADADEIEDLKRRIVATVREWRLELG